MAVASLAAGRTPSARARRSGELVAVCVALLLTTAPAAAQDLGHKLPGLLGLDAARIPEPGLYFVEFNAAVAYRSLIGEFFWNRLVRATPEPSWLSANGYVYIK